MRRRTLTGALIAAAMVTAIPAAWASVRINTGSKALVSNSGSVRFWDMTQGTVTAWDTTSEWNTGTHSNTSAESTPGTLTLRPSGSTGPTSRAWWNLSWSTRRCFNLSGSGTALAGQKVKLTFDSTADVANGWLLAGGADLRAIANDNTTSLPLYLATAVPSAATSVMVVVDIPAAGTTVCLYSGNAAATTVSNPTPFISTIYQVDAGSASPPTGWMGDAATSTWLNSSVTASSTLTTTATIAVGTTGVPIAVLRNARTWDANTLAGPLTYTIPGLVPGSAVTIRAFFAEDWSANRTFDVLINGAVVESAFDAKSAAGGFRRGIVRIYTATASAAGTVTLSLAKNTTIPSGWDPDPIINGFAVDGTAALSTSIVTPAASEGLYASMGLWESPTLDSGTGPAIYGAVFADPLAPTLGGATYQIATSGSPTGPWTYVGPDGTAATTFTGGQQPTAPASDGQRYARIRFTLTAPSRLASPTVGVASIRYALPILARPAGGRSTQLARASSTVLRNDGSWVASQSSVGFGGVAARAIDGNVDGNFTAASTQHSGSGTAPAGTPEPNPWWQVDLGQSRTISGVRIWNRTDCCDTRTTNVTVLVSDVPFVTPATSTPGVTVVNFPGTIGRPTELSFARAGRYVRVQLNATQWMHVSEVEIVSPVAMLTKITGAETGLSALNDSLIHESTSGAALTSVVWLGSARQIQLTSGTPATPPPATPHVATSMIISATGQLPGAGLAATHQFTFRAIWPAEQLRIERPMLVNWAS